MIKEYIRYDNYGNYAVVEYEKLGVATNSPTRIVRIYDQEGKEVRFSYNPQNRLSEITDTRGRKTKYEYGETKLLKVKYDTGKEITFGYLNNNITLVKEEKNALRTNLSYNANKLSSVNNYSTIDGIPKTNTSEVSSLISSTTITYQQRPADMGGMRAEFDFRTYIGTLRGLSERQNRGKTTVIV